MAREVLSAAAMALTAAAALPDVPAAWLARELALGFSLAPPEPAATQNLTPERSTAASLRGTKSGHGAGGPEVAPAECPPAGPGPLAGRERGEGDEGAASTRAHTALPGSSSGGGNPGAGAIHGVVGAHLAARGAALFGELACVGPLGRLAALRGLVIMLPAATLCAPLRWSEADHVCAGDRQPSGTHDSVAASGAAPLAAPAAPAQRAAPAQGDMEAPAWTLLAHGLLPAAAALVQALPDAHFRFHAAQLLLACLQRMEACLMVRAASLPPSCRTGVQACCFLCYLSRSTCGWRPECKIFYPILTHLCPRMLELTLSNCCLSIPRLTLTIVHLVSLTMPA